MNKASDFFADIATARMGVAREPLVSPPAPVIPDRALALCPPGERRPRHSKITSAAEAQKALAGLRERYAPFMQDLAPSQTSFRSALPVTAFDWRIETAEDRQHFDGVQKGKGTWEPVSIPHYGPPLGKASTLYRTEIDIPAGIANGEAVRLYFGGVDYKCQAYLNGLCIGTHEGFFEEFWFDCAGAIRPGRNVLIVRVENDYSMFGENEGGVKIDGNKIYAATGLGYDDPQLGWHHCPPGMGIWNRVYFEALPRLFIDDLWVRPLVESEEIEVRVEIESRSQAFEEDVILKASVYGQNFDAVIHEDFVYRGEAKFVRGYGDLIHGFDEVIPSLMGKGRNYVTFRLPLKAPRIWSPETPWLYQVQIRLIDQDGATLDTAKAQFGMRSFIQDENSTPKGKFFLNGREIRLRGANTMGNFERCIMQGDFDQLRDDILWAKLTNMNYLRMTQRPVHREFYDYCDRLGMMLQTDLPMFSTIRRNQFLEVVRQAGRMERHVRGHCSNIVVSYINEPRPAAGSKPHRFLYRQEMETLFDMATRLIRQHNPDRVVKYVDGDYDPPASAGMPDNHVYCGWYIGHGIDLGALHHGQWLPVKEGWHYGCGEFGAEGLDSYEVMTSEYPEAWKPASPDTLWNPKVISMSQTWNFHFLWYESQTTARDWIEKSQEFQDWAIGLMTRGYRLKAGMNSFAVHLFIDAWPAGWMKTLMDVHRIPKKVWFTYRDALSPVAVLLRSDRTQLWSGESIPVEAWVCNDHSYPLSGLKLVYEVTQNGCVIASGDAPAEAGACMPQCQGVIRIAVPQVTERGAIEIGASLLDETGKVLHDHILEFEVFPRQPAVSATVWCPEASDALKQWIARLGLTLTERWTAEAKTIVFADSAVYERHRDAIDRAVQAGAAAVAVNLPSGSYRLGSSPSFNVQEASMGPRHFVSRATGHPLVEGFRADDFRFWFHESLGRVAPLLTSMIEAPEWTSILLTGDGGWSRPWDYRPAAAEHADGNGMWRICQIELIDCIGHNPVAREFSTRLLQPLGS